jgi:multiple sugar transport system ATP-binding protein
MVAITLENLTKKFGKVVAVDHINLEVEDKEFVTLLGPSGCGKTTTLRLIAGLETPTEGEIYFDGKPVTDIPPHKRNVAMVFQDYALYPHMNAYDNMAFSLKMKKTPSNEIRRLVKETAELLKIEHLLDRFPSELSGGEKQRVALGRALVRQPAVFLLDEPLSGIDAKLREEMRSELIKIHERIQTTFIYVTHDQLEAMTLSNRVAVMNHGRVIQFDTPMNLYNKPLDIFVASFVGSPTINLFTGRIVKEPTGDRLLFDGESFIYPLPKSLKLPETIIGSKITLGVRPEDISVTKPGEREGISTAIYTREPRGDETILSVKFKDVLVKAKVDPEIGFQAGDTVTITFKKGYLFDGNSKLFARW